VRNLELQQNFCSGCYNGPVRVKLNTILNSPVGLIGMLSPTFIPRGAWPLYLSAVLLTSCTSPRSTPKPRQTAPEQQEAVLTLEAEYFRKDGQTRARLTRSSGNKAIDAATLKLLEDLAGSVHDLKEGESRSVKLDDLGMK